MVRKDPFLFKSRHGIWYVRVAVPTDKRADVGRTELRRSLDTGSIRQARRKAPEVLRELFELISSTNAPVKDQNPSQAHTEPYTSIQPAKSPSVSKIMDLYAQSLEYEEVSLKTIDDKRAIVRLLVRVIGDKGVSSFTAEDARCFRDTCLKLPPRLSKYPEDWSLEKIINEAQGTITVTTWNNYAKNIKSVFQFGVREGYISSNPFRSLAVRTKKKANSYRGIFKESEVAQIFKHTEHETGWKYWLPRLAMYTGCRMSELCQLYIEDIAQVKGITCIHVQARHDDQSIKSSSSERVIPLHSKLIELEFIEYVLARGTGRLFPDLVKHPKHGYSATPSKWFARLRTQLGMTDRTPRIDFHSFRHTVADQLKQMGYSENLIGGLLGHTTGGITHNRYGKEYHPKSLLEVVEAIQA